MKKEEARVLHGLYFDNQIIDDPGIYTPAEINWLNEAKWWNGRHWRQEDGKRRSLEEKGNHMDSLARTLNKAEKSLSYLKAFDYINYEKSGLRINIIFHVAVTGKGADVARELDHCWGRINLLYKDQKDGVLWFIATVLVSMITALIAK